nr:hypothetical protein [Coxiella burnetii]
MRAQRAKARWIPACAGMTVKKINLGINFSILGWVFY